MKTDTIGDAEVAKMLGYSCDVFQRIWKTLVDQDGLPPPHHNRKRDGLLSTRRKWDRTAIERWRDRARPPHLRNAAAHDPLAAERERLRRRMAHLDAAP